MTAQNRIEIDGVVFERRGSQVAYWSLNGRRRRVGPTLFASVRQARKYGQKFLESVMSQESPPGVQRDLLAHGGAWLAIAGAKAKV
jgi:hypothetical protein